MKIEDNRVFMDLNLTLQIYLKEDSSMVDRAENGSKNMNHPIISCSILIILLRLFGPIHYAYCNRARQSIQSVREREEADTLQVLCCVNVKCPILGIKEHQEHTLA